MKLRTKLILITAVICACTTANAEKFDNWPTYGIAPVSNWPTASGYENLIQDIGWVYGAIDERGETIRVQNNWDPSSVSALRDHRSIMESLKHDFYSQNDYLYIDGLGKGWVRKDLATGGNFSDHFAATNKPNDFPFIEGIEEVCASANIPINFFDYTPFRCLSGVGPLTNDQSVGTGHGWTNTYTAAGGTNFPGSKSTWYTTDYGWSKFKEAVKVLLWTRECGETDASERCHVNAQGLPYPHPDTISNAYASNNAAWAAEEWRPKGGLAYDYYVSTHFYGYEDTGWVFVSERRAATNASGWWRTKYLLQTNIAHSAQLYLRLGCDTDEILYDFDNITLDGIRGTNVYHYIEEFSEAATNTRVTSKYPVDRTNPMLIKWPTPPSTNENRKVYAIRETWFNDILWLLKWDGTNGFQYK